MTNARLTVTVNGEERSVGTGTLLDLLSELGSRPELVAIEYNGNIIPRARFGETSLADGDRVEIVQFVQGG